MYVRLGMSESSLVLLYFIEHNIKNFNMSLMISMRKHILNWLFSTSGYFDVEIKGRLFEFNNEYDKIIKGNTYRKYFKDLLEFIKNNTFDEFYFKCHDLGIFCNYITVFYKYINKTQSEYNIRSILYKELDSKRVLLMHNLSELMIQQYDNGTVHKIYTRFPKVELFIPFKIGYTFMNTPMNECNNIIERAELIENAIDEYVKEYNIDFVIISCGAYSNLFASFLHKKNIRYAMIGGELEHEFGIIIQRHNQHPEINHHFIKVPDNLKPQNHSEIENSCYW